MVAMADFDVAKSPNALATTGIGSCVAVCLHDRKNRAGGLIHIMLPRSKGNDNTLRGRYADTGIAALIRHMGQGGLTAKIAGGASMFVPEGQPAAITVGKNNIDSVRKILAERNIRILAEDTGGTHGRALVFDVETGAVEVTVLTDPPARITI
jgi:chemotaxis protein CheD